MDNIRVLLIGNESGLNDIYWPEYVKVYDEGELLNEKCKDFDIAFILRLPSEYVHEPLMKHTKAYSVYVGEGIKSDAFLNTYIKSKKAKFLINTTLQRFITENIRNFFPKPYGEKYTMNNLVVSRNFTGSIKWDGNYALELNGDYGDSLRQISYLRMYIPVHREQALDFWFEYEKDDTVDVSLELSMFRAGEISTEINHWSFNGDDLNDLCTIEGGNTDSYLFMSFSAKGSGRLKLIALHSRYSRRGFGQFIPGGERLVTSKREEVFAYFNPGDLKPPLNVYFSGYKTKEGFEGFNMMHRLGSPFLLIAEPRLEGGAFYLGDDEYEGLITGKIKDCLSELGFTEKDLVLSGISMGSFGAAYYACKIPPKIVLLGKPLLDLGDVAANERLSRPGGFPTSLDVLKHNEGSCDDEAIARFNARFFDEFKKTNWEKTKFVVSYMIEDDYDRNAYGNILESLTSEGVEIYGRGLHGRHNDNTGGIFQWFSSQHKTILIKDFNRKID